MTKPSEIIDLCHDLRLHFPRIVKASEWGGSPIYVVTFGYMAYRQTVTFPATTSIQEAKGIISQAASVSRNVSREANVGSHS